ncbi:SDR family NAD(P)-dependent oxidoreductase [Flavobacterium myungsuense]|uniref:SDR family NAD(P)-dependent oxidoreductase n=1 Tax=Flavobacterium myungsuense TaxID=651823 RepID=A0ABW3IZY5_9FLAO
MIEFINFSGKTILVTGATSGIGYEICMQIANFNGNIIAVGRNQEKLNDLANKMTKRIHFKGVLYDLENLDKLENLIEIIKIPIDGIVHAAGIVQLQPIKFLDMNLLNKIRTINYDSIVLIISKLLKKKLINKNASIIFISSIAGEVGMKGNFIYSSTKASLNSSAKVFASELSGQNIRVNCIAPGQVETTLTESVAKQVSAEAIIVDRKKYPLGYGKPEDIAHLALFLLSDKSSWITGTTITIDGGRSNILN